MLRSFLMGLVAGQRGLTPLAAIAIATQRREIDADLPLQSLLLNPVVAAGTLAMAAAEMGGDKMKSAPDRTVPAGLAVRAITSAYAGAAVAPRGQRAVGAAVALTTAMVSSYVGLQLRTSAMARYGQTRTGLAEDALVLGSAVAIANPGMVGTQPIAEGR